MPFMRIPNYDLVAPLESVEISSQHINTGKQKYLTMENP